MIKTRIDQELVRLLDGIQGNHDGMIETAYIYVGPYGVEGKPIFDTREIP